MESENDLNRVINGEIINNSAYVFGQLLPKRFHLSAFACRSHQSLQTKNK